MRRSGKISEDFDRLLAGKTPPAENSLEEVERLVHNLKAAYSSVPAKPEVQASHLSAIMDEVQSSLRNGESLAPSADHGAALSNWKKVMLRGASASLALKIIGGAVALAGTTGGLAALEALPEPAQAPVATAVEVVTPFDLPGNEEKKAGPDRKLEIDEVPPANLPPAPNPNASFGQNVAEDARDGGVSGQQIKDEAREQAEKRREEGHSHRPDEVPPAGPADIPAAPQGAGPPAGVGSGKGGPQSGLDDAGQRPAGQHIPQSVPAGPPGQTGR